MPIHPLAGKTVPPADLVDPSALVAAYHDRRPDPAVPGERVAFGTSGHRGSSIDASFNDAHIAAICQAIADHRRALDITGPLYLGKDTHALSEPALVTAVEVFAANGVELRVQAGGGFTPTPVVSHAILRHNHGRADGLADGVILTPSHNPPRDGGIKYNPPHGGPAGSDVTAGIEKRANEILRGRPSQVARTPYRRALEAPTSREHDFVRPYVADLAHVIDLEIIRERRPRIGVDPMGGSSVAYWDPIRTIHGIALDIVNEAVDPTFAFLPADHDGLIRMDCSSPHAMAGLVALRDRFDVAIGNDPDADRHGIVTPSAGLLSPNAYLAVAVDYLFRHRPGWGAKLGVGKTLVSSGLIDRAAARLGRDVYEVPVGFKWFVEGLVRGTTAFAGEESAGATLLRRDGTMWTTDKDGIALGLLAAEITARTGRDIASLHADLESALGRSYYRRSDVAASRAEKAALAAIDPANVRVSSLAGEPVRAVLTRAPGNGAPIGGIKVVADGGWFAARPSGTEDVYKVYAESFRDDAHLAHIERDARVVVRCALESA